MKNAIEINGTLYKTQALHGMTPVTLLTVHGEDVVIEHLTGAKDIQPLSQITLTAFVPEFPFYIKDADGTEIAVMLTSRNGEVVAKNTSIHYGVDRLTAGLTSGYYDAFLEGKYVLTTREEFIRIKDEAEKRTDADVFFEYDAQRLDKDDDEMNDRWSSRNRIADPTDYQQEKSSQENIAA